MTNIEAMTIGALAKLEHQLNVDVTRHLREMGLMRKTMTPVLYTVKELENLQVTLVAGGAADGGYTGATGGGCSSARGFSTPMVAVSFGGAGGSAA